MARFPYEDPALPTKARVEDLLGRMTLGEKAGLLFINMLCPGPDGSSLSGPVPAMDILDTAELLGAKHMSHFNLVGPVTDARAVAAWHNRLQQHVLDHTRLGIPVTLASDPRHQFSSNVGTGFRAGALSQWPETWGFGALRDPALARTFGACVAAEYAAVGLRLALHPQADLATEYRWARSQSTYGEDADLAAALAATYIEGLQTVVGGSPGVAAMTKHFPGSGPQRDGEDSHFVYGKDLAYPGDNMDYHLKPFRAAIQAGTRHIMPAYGKPIGTQYEEVGIAFNKGLITGVLREQLGFTGIVCTDWGLLTDAVLRGQAMPARAWGCEHLSALQRAVKILDAGCDQFGGESRPELVVEAVRRGLVAESRVDRSARRLLREKFELGLFDGRRFVDVEAAAHTVGNARFRRLGRDAQRRAFTVLVNQSGAFPITAGATTSEALKVYAEGLSADAVAVRPGLRLVAAPADADVALLRLRAPFEPRPGGFESKFHAGSLEFPAAEVARLVAIVESVRFTLLDVYLDRPAVLTPLVAAQERVNRRRSAAGGGGGGGGGSALMVNFGADDDAFLDVCLGVGGPALAQGRLPFDLPRSHAAAAQSREDVPFDTAEPLFRFGAGLAYP